MVSFASHTAFISVSRSVIAVSISISLTVSPSHTLPLSQPRWLSISVSMRELTCLLRFAALLLPSAAALLSPASLSLAWLSYQLPSYLLSSFWSRPESVLASYQLP